MTTTVLPTRLAASRPGPLPSAGYKVDISRGERIGRVSSEWFSRPDDERFLSLTELHTAVRARAERATAPHRRDQGASRRGPAVTMPSALR